MRMELETITPERAAKLLSAQVPNRRIKATKVEEWSRDMTAGRWHPIPQPIMINDDGRLIDGQNRLAAVIKSGCSVPMYVAYGVSDEMRRYIDGGTTRSAADVLTMELGMKNTAQLQALARSVLLYQQHQDKVWTAAIAPGKQVIVDEVTADSDLYGEAISLGLAATKNAGSGLWLTRSSYGALYVLVQRQSKFTDLWEGWNSGVTTGAGLELGDPRLTLRSSRIITAGSTGASRLQWGVHACIKAWNAYVSGEQMRLMRVASARYLPMADVL